MEAESAYDKDGVGATAVVMLTSPKTKKRKLTLEERAARDAEREAKKIALENEKEAKRIQREKEKAEREAKKAALAAEKENRRVEREKQAEEKRKALEAEKLSKEAERDAKTVERKRKEQEKEELRLQKVEEKKRKEEEKERAEQQKRLAEEQRHNKIKNMWAKVGVKPIIPVCGTSGGSSISTKPTTDENQSTSLGSEAVQPSKDIAPKRGFDDLFPPLEAGPHTVVAPPLVSSSSLSPKEIEQRITAGDWSFEQGLEWLRSRAIVQKKGKRTRVVESREERRKAILSERDGDVAQGPRFKLFQFHFCNRPAYYGTWSKRSTCIRPRNPLAKDTDLIDYEFDSDDEWEEEEPGEDLEAMENIDNDDEEGEDMEDDDPFVVPDGYLSEGEASLEDDEIVSKDVLGSKSDGMKVAKKVDKTGESTGYQRLVAVSLGPIYDMDAVTESVRKQESAGKLPANLKNVGFSLDNPQAWTAQKIATEVLARCKVVPLTAEPVGEFYEGDNDDFPAEPDTGGGEGRESRGVAPRSVPENLVALLAKLLHGSILPRDKLVKQFHLEHSEISKAQIEKKILEIGRKEKGDSDSYARWRVIPELLKEYGLVPELPPLPTPEFPKIVLLSLVKFVHGSILGREKLVKEFYDQFVKGKGEEFEMPRSHIDKKVLEIAVKDKREPTPTVSRWYVKDEVMLSLQLSLELPQLAESELDRFPADLLTELVKWVHGSTLGREKLVKEFHDSMKEKNVEVKKAHIERKILEIAVKERREPVMYVARWYVNSDVLSSLGVSEDTLLPVPVADATKNVVPVVTSEPTVSAFSSPPPKGMRTLDSIFVKIQETEKAREGESMHDRSVSPVVEIIVPPATTSE